MTRTDCLTSDAYVLDNVLSPAECALLIRRGEESGGFSFWDSTRDEVELERDFRNADTIEVTHPSWADLIYQRMAPFVTATVDIQESQKRWEPDLTGAWDADGMNTNLLLARYESGGHFGPHTDGCTLLNFDHRSIYSVIIYLNACPTGGGETRLLEDSQLQKLTKDAAGRFRGDAGLAIDAVEPKPGRAFVFFHTIVHEGLPPNPGSSKFIIRTDVMFKRRDPVCKTPKDHAAFQLYEEAKEKEGEGDITAALALFRRSFKMSPALEKIYG